MGSFKYYFGFSVVGSFLFSKFCLAPNKQALVCQHGLGMTVKLQGEETFILQLNFLVLFSFLAG